MPDLPVPTDTLILPDGTVYDPVSGILDPAVAASTEVENGRTAIALVSRMKRTLGDMPAIPRDMNPVACVIVYTQVGLEDDAIAQCLNCHVDDIKRLKDSEIYTKLTELFDERVFDDEQRTARHIISKHSAKAANKIISLVDAKSGDLALAAARDVMRISGVDKSQQATGLSSLKIVMMDKADVKQEITVTLEK